MQVKAKNLLVAGIVVLLVGLLWYTVVYSPMEAKASKAKTAAHAADSSAATMRTAISSAAAAKKATKAHVVSTAAMLAAIPVDDAEAAFLRSVDALRVTSGASWQSITPTAPSAQSASSIPSAASAPSASAGIATINVVITVQGSSAELLRYASGLYDLKRIFLLDNMSLTVGTSASSGSAPAPGQLQISGRIFKQPSVAAAGTTGTAGTTPVTGAPATKP